MRSSILVPTLLVVATACSPNFFGEDDVSSLMEMVGDEDSAMLNLPQDLGMNPDRDELWVVNKADDSVSILTAPGTAGQSVENIVDTYALHFMEKVTSIAFGAPGTFATCQDGTNTYNRPGEGNGFTGPSLWTTDMEIFGKTNPAAVDALDGTDLGSHLDMLHESPECMGIAWDHDNVYWVFDGFNGDIVRYDFAADHGAGYDDHCDGDIQRWDADVERVPGVVSHLVMDHETGLLYVSDTGNDRVLVIDTNTGEAGDELPSIEEGSCQQVYNKPGPAHYEQDDGDIQVLVEGISRPSGIALVDGTLVVASNGTGKIHAFNLKGKEIGEVDTGVGPSALAGIMMPSVEELWFIDSDSEELFRVDLP